MIAGTSFNSSGADRAFRYYNGVMMDLGTLGGDYSYARGMSADGSVIVGESFTSGGDMHAFKYDGVDMIDIGTLGGTYSFARGVSGNGLIIVGDSTTSGGDTHAFKYDGVDMMDLGTLGGASSIAYGASFDGSVIVGSSDTSGGNSHAFKYDGVDMTDLGTLSGHTGSIASAVSADGLVVVGYSYSGFGFTGRAFKHDGVDITDLGTLGGLFSRAFGVSSDGSVIVGSSTNSDGNTRAFKYEGSTMSDIGTLGGTYAVAYGVSADGSVIVGQSTTEGDANYHAFVYRDQMVDINNSAATVYNSGVELNSLLNLKSALMVNNMRQDCNNFGQNNICVGIGARHSSVNKHYAEEQAGILKAAYQFNDYFHAGFVLDQDLHNNDPSSFKTSEKMPMTTIFANVAQNKDGSGLNLRVAGSYTKSKLNITRNATLPYTEAGSGNSDFSARGLLGQITYKRQLTNNLTIVPSFGMTYARMMRDSYKESAATSFPVYYHRLKQTSTAINAGINVQLNYNKKVTLIAGGGFEHNLQAKINNYSGYIDYMGAFEANAAHIMDNRVTMNVGSVYHIDDNQRFSSHLYHAKQQFNNAYTTMLYLGYERSF